METPLSICFDGAIGCQSEPIVRVVEGYVRRKQLVWEVIIQIGTMSDSEEMLFALTNCNAVSDEYPDTGCGCESASSPYVTNVCFPVAMLHKNYFSVIDPAGSVWMASATQLRLAESAITFQRVEFTTVA
jgi:hypothetical protein